MMENFGMMAGIQSESGVGTLLRAQKTVLIVDDDLDIREMLTELLEEEGYKPIAACNGLEALLRLRAHGPLPNLILLDLMMPGMNGWELYDALKREPAFSAIPVVVMSANGREAPAGVAARMKKPVHLQALLDTIRELADCPA